MPHVMQVQSAELAQRSAGVLSSADTHHQTCHGCRVMATVWPNTRTALHTVSRARDGSLWCSYIAASCCRCLWGPSSVPCMLPCISKAQLTVVLASMQILAKCPSLLRLVKPYNRQCINSLFLPGSTQHLDLILSDLMECRGDWLRPQQWVCPLHP
jgi:hypothetical protein